MQETKGRVEGSAAPALYGMIADLIQLLHDRKHLLGRHTVLQSETDAHHEGWSQ